MSSRACKLTSETYSAQPFLCVGNRFWGAKNDLLMLQESKFSTLSVEEILRVTTSMLTRPGPACPFERKTKPNPHPPNKFSARFSVTPFEGHCVGIFQDVTLMSMAMMIMSMISVIANCRPIVEWRQTR